MKTVALTGATGFVGRITLDRLIAAGWHVRALTRRDQHKKAGVTWVHGSLNDTVSLTELCKGAVALGADGLLVEVHPNPAEAMSDGQQQVDFHAFRGLIEGIQPFLHATGRTL